MKLLRLKGNVVIGELTEGGFQPNEEASTSDEDSIKLLLTNKFVTMVGGLKVVRGKTMSISNFAEIGPGDPDFFKTLVGDLPIYGYEIVDEVFV